MALGVDDTGARIMELIYNNATITCLRCPVQPVGIKYYYYFNSVYNRNITWRVYDVILDMCIASLCLFALLRVLGHLPHELLLESLTMS